MTMIFQLLVFTCACALSGAGNVVKFRDMWSTIEAALTILEHNVLSMEGNVPALNDPRRHYANIVYVVSSEALAESDNYQHDYYGDYQKDVNQSLPFADANPEIVIHETRKRIDYVLEVLNEGNKRNFLATGIAATELVLADEQYFADASRNLTSQEFVIKGAQKLLNVVMGLKNLYQLIYVKGG